MTGIGIYDRLVINVLYSSIYICIYLSEIRNFIEDRCHCELFQKEDIQDTDVFLCFVPVNTFQYSPLGFWQRTFSISSLQCFLLLKINATAKYLSAIWECLFGSYLSLRNKKETVFLLCWEYMAFHFLCFSLNSSYFNFTASTQFQHFLPHV